MFNRNGFNTMENKRLKLAALVCSMALVGCASTAPKEPIKAADGSPATKFDLLGWSYTGPVDNDGNGKSDQIKEEELAAGYIDEKHFYLNKDGGMVFVTPIKGAKTSKNTKYTRSELREMLRRGNDNYDTKGVTPNNWVFSTAPKGDLQDAGGIDGTFDATLAVNHVTTTGVNWQQGRVIIGQIHANDDEPIRLYYRKLPHHTKGSIYFAHEPRKGDEIWTDMVGNSLPNFWNQTATPSDPKDGIALGEKFSYQIKVTGHELKVTLKRNGKKDIVKKVDMSKSQYDQGGQYMYFKAGVYNQNKTGDAKDYVQATFYDLNISHDAPMK